jgi:hypothetical protein
MLAKSTKPKEQAKIKREISKRPPAPVKLEPATATE